MDDISFNIDNDGFSFFQFKKCLHFIAKYEFGLIIINDRTGLSIEKLYVDYIGHKMLTLMSA